MLKDSKKHANSFYEVRAEYSNDVPKTNFKIKIGKTLSQRKWQSAFSQEGYLDISPTLRRILRGGIHPSIRGEVWEFLLGCFDPNTTFDERDQLRQKRRINYARLKEQCREMDNHVGSGKIITSPLITKEGVPIQDPLSVLQAIPNQVDSRSETEFRNSNSHVISDKRIIEWKLTLHQIGLDVLRTDRTLKFYEKQGNLSKLWDVLAVYSWIDRDVGYCQGMSDLCSPLVILFDNEADAFWCFQRMMRKLRVNFKCTEQSLGVERQLQSLASITQIIDPKLHQHLETLGVGDYLFAFRMFMVLFRREFSFGDSLYLWEMMWALEYDPDLYSIYEELEGAVAANKKEMVPIGKVRSKHNQFGKYERENKKHASSGTEAPLPISVFLVASVLKEKSAKLLQEAHGLDDVIKILNDVTGSIDARKACIGAMKLHKKYLKLKAKKETGLRR